jgi:hypothetical protein
MKKILMIVAFVAAVVAMNTACDINAEIRPHLVIDNIYVEPADWREYTVDGYFDHYFADIPMPELTQEVLDLGFFHTFWKYTEEGEKSGTQVEVQQGEGIVRNVEVFEGGQWIRYQEFITCSYSLGNLRIAISSSDGQKRRPTETLYFRMVIFR